MLSLIDFECVIILAAINDEKTAKGGDVIVRIETLVTKARGVEGLNDLFF